MMPRGVPLTREERESRIKLKIHNIKTQIEFLESCLRSWERVLEKEYGGERK